MGPSRGDGRGWQGGSWQVRRCDAFSFLANKFYFPRQNVFDYGPYDFLRRVFMVFYFHVNFIPDFKPVDRCQLALEVARLD